MALRVLPAAFLAIATLLACDSKKGEVRSPLPRVVETTPEQLVAAIHAPGAKAVVVNAWATTCVPCVQELPALLAVAKRHRESGVRLLLVSFDVDVAPQEISRFLASRGVDFDTFLRSGSSGAFVDALSKDWNGTLPATFFYDGAGTLRHVLEGKSDAAAFERGIKDLLGDPR